MQTCVAMPCCATLLITAYKYQLHTDNNVIKINYILITLSDNYNNMGNMF
jgi:hypothetical protein